MAWRPAWLVLPVVVVALVPGCGLNLDSLTCGSSTCADSGSPAVTNGGMADGFGPDSSSGADSVVSEPDATVDVAASPSDATVGETSVDGSEVDANGNGQTESSVPAGEGGCVTCGGSPCCAPNQCANGGTLCCAGPGGDCENCCSNLVCNALQKCAPTCNQSGASCMAPGDCCRGTYCGSNNTCIPCLDAGVTCTTGIAGECCGGTCMLGVCHPGGN